MRCHSALGDDSIDRIHQLKVPVADTADLVGGQVDIHCTVNVGPFRVVVVLFSEQSNLCDKTKGVNKILKYQPAIELIVDKFPL